MALLLTRFKNLRFKQKLIISYIVVSIIPLLALGTFSYNQASRFLLRQAEQNLDGSIGQIATTINYRSGQYESVINSITQNIVFRQIFMTNPANFPVLYRDYVDPFFSNILSFNKDLLQISVFTDNSDILRGEYILPIALLDRMPWAEGLGDAGSTKWNLVNGKLFAVRPFEADEPPRDGTPRTALLFLSIDADSMLHGLTEVQTEAYGIRIEDRQGRTLYSAYEKLERTDTADRGDYVYMTKEIPETGWRLVCFAPKKSLSVDATSIVNATALIVVICIGVLIFIIGLFSNGFVKRIISLNKKMTMVETGNLKISVSSSARDEIGQLTNKFGHMLANVNRLIEEVYQSKITQKEAELRALQTQINPHFLYNTLSIINWKALEIDAMEISQITNSVSRFYRAVLNKGKSIISVASELENATAYMQIQLIMHNYNFDFACDVEEELLQYDMINIVFQPILENALEHGIDQLRKGSRRGRIALRGQAEGDDMTFEVADNGPGIREELAEEVLTSSSTAGYGLKNVHDRIQIRFGAAYGVWIRGTPGEGTTVYIKFPKFRAPNSSGD
ncbi:sensor histidine kinase [Cohnella ginsengisoli]|uniref:histidine kinase n=1 Tax=Cohnella ginsengisoli TaxID=425004 RepID=A0A9X4QMW3_9BACL|nr:histidine kinase [Cohnella ginsengisoli]MDG0792168.1 sensor histidine kinase [Cohnella ginsengisoli]